MCPPLLAAVPAAIGTAASAAASAASTAGFGTIAGLAGTGLSAYGAIQQGNARKAAADAQAAAYNQQAVSTLQQGQYEAQRKQEDIDRTMGTYIAQAAGSGIDLSSNSLTDGVAGIASNGALDVGAIQNNHLAQARNLVYQGQLARQGGQADQQAGVIGAFGSAVDGLTKLGLPYGGQTRRPYDDDVVTYGTGNLY